MLTIVSRIVTSADVSDKWRVFVQHSAASIGRMMPVNYSGAWRAWSKNSLCQAFCRWNSLIVSDSLRI